MKKCNKCGAELPDDTHYCQYCGNQVDAVLNETISQSAGEVIQDDETSKTLGILSIVFFETFIIGLILGIIGLSKSKTESNRKLNKIGIGLSIGALVIGLIIFALALMFVLGLFTTLGNAVQEGVNQSIESLTA